VPPPGRNDAHPDGGQARQTGTPVRDEEVRTYTVQQAQMVRKGSLGIRSGRGTRYIREEQEGKGRERERADGSGENEGGGRVKEIDNQPLMGRRRMSGLR